MKSPQIHRFLGNKTWVEVRFVAEKIWMLHHYPLAIKMTKEIQPCMDFPMKTSISLRDFHCNPSHIPLCLHRTPSISISHEFPIHIPFTPMFHSHSIAHFFGRPGRRWIHSALRSRSRDLTPSGWCKWLAHHEGCHLVREIAIGWKNHRKTIGKLEFHGIDGWFMIAKLMFVQFHYGNYV